MKALRSPEPGFFESFLQSAQYLVGLQTEQDIWEHLGKFVLTHFPADWLAFVERGSGNALSLAYCTLPAAEAAQVFTSEVRDLVTDVLESGFLASSVLPAPASMTAFVPVSENSQAIGAMLIGHDDAQALPKDLLNIYLALAGLAGAAAQRKRVELQVRRLNAELEQRVVERTAQLRTANEELLKEILERKRAEEALIRTEKLAATGRLAATMAHEINNPLEAMTNVIYLLGQSVTDSTARKYLLIVEKQLHTISRITSQTLKFHRTPGIPKEFELAELIAELVEFYKPKAMHRHITLTARIETQANFRGFNDDIRQVVANLLLNAIDATPEGGRVTIHLYGSSEWRGRHRHGFRISVADSGAGIAPEHLPRIFEPFFTTKGESGTGLGLWVTSGIINRADGFLRVRSTQQPGRSGTCFSIFLPTDTRITRSCRRRRYEVAP